MRAKVLCGLLALSVNGMMPLCKEYYAWFGDNFGTITDGPGAYHSLFRCRWQIDGDTANGSKNICIRFRYEGNF